MCIWCLPSSQGCSTSASHGDSLWCPTTLSMMTLSGHGVARLVKVSTSIAANMISNDPRYGRISWRMSVIKGLSPGFLQQSTAQPVPSEYSDDKSQEQQRVARRYPLHAHD